MLLYQLVLEVEQKRSSSVADFQEIYLDGITQFKPVSSEPICSSWIFIHTLLFKHLQRQLVGMNEFLVMCICVYLCVCVNCMWVCRVSGEKAMTFYNHLHTHPKQTLSIYTGCCLFVHCDSCPRGVTWQRLNIHVLYLTTVWGRRAIHQQGTAIKSMC